MTVEFSGNGPHLPNGEAEELLLALDVPGPIIATNGSMPLPDAQKAVQRALRQSNAEPLAQNLRALEEALTRLQAHGAEQLDWW